MFKTKKDVDRHVRTALSNLRSESEKNLRGFMIAKLYYKINEYATAQHYVSGYLSVKEDSSPAHKLLGQCYLHLKKPDKALASFQRSLQLDPKQHDLLVEVCKLLLADNSINANKAKYWCDLAESEKVQHDAVFSLRLKLLNKDSLETKQIEELILREIASRPNDVNLRVRLVKHFVEQDKVMDAFKYAFDLQIKNHDLFSNSSEWYNVVGLVLSKYKQLTNIKKNWDFWLLLIICYEKQVEISFSITGDIMANAGTTETANLLFTFDQCLFEASKCITSLCPERELAKEFLRHYRGQLCLFSAALIFKREIVQNKNQWGEAIKNALPLLFLAYQSGTPDTQEMWLKHSRDQSKYLIRLWNREGAFRCSQAGKTILSCIESPRDSSVSAQVQQILSESHCWSNTDEILAQIRKFCSDNAWRSKLFRILFPNSDQIIKMQSSLLINSEDLAEPSYEIVTYSDVETYEDIAQYLKPQSLQHMVYLCLGSENLADVRCKFFNGLNFSVQNLAFCGADSLNQLDIETFLYAAAIQAQRALEVEKAFYYGAKSVGKPKILPFVNIVENLCTEEQITWWTYAFQVYKNLVNDNLGEVRTTLQYGLEALRGINGPKIDLIIVLKLGKIFVTRAQEAVKPLEKNFLEARAENLYKYGLNMLKLHNKGVLEPYRKLFKYSNANSSQVEREINTLAEEAITHLAAKYFKNSEYEECIEELSGIQLPFATYCQAEAYRKLDESNKTPKKNKKIYLDKARDCLNQTLNLLGSININTNHPLNSIVHSEIKRLQYTNKFANESFSNGPYSDQMDEFFDSTPTFHNTSNSRMRRSEILTSSPRSAELENLIKQMASTLTFLKEELIDVIKPEVTGIKKELSNLKEKFETLEENLKKKSNPPSRDDDPNDLGDLYIIDDELQNQIYQPNMYPNFSQNQGIQQNQRMHTPNSLLNQPSQHHPPTAPHHQPSAPTNPYNNPLYNPSYSMNYFPQYVMPGPHPAAAPLQTAQRATLGLNQHSMPFVDHALNFNIPVQPQPPQQMQLPAPPDNRTNLFNLLTQTSVAQEKLQPAQPVPTTNPNIWNRLYNSGPVEKGPPVNVVITSSDPLPTNTTSFSQPTLSVTIPAQHIKPSIVANEPVLNLQSNPIPFMQHNTNFPIITNSIPSVSTSTTATLSPISVDAVPSTKNKNNIPAPKSPEVVSNKSLDSFGNDTLNKSNEGEYDPRPDFKPVIPLPEEIEVKTGEEDEEVLFCSRAKLFRYIDKEWKERGLGDMKILKNKTDGKIRILMRREQTHKICANHIITNEMNLSQARNEEKSYIWAANDFADEELKVEKLCVRFKHVETAKDFYNVFMKAKDEAKDINPVVSGNEEKSEPAPIPLTKAATFNFGKETSTTKVDTTTTITASSSAPTLFGPKPSFGISTSTNKKSTGDTKTSPFATFSFTSASGSTWPPADKTNSFANILASINKNTQSESAAQIQNTPQTTVVTPATPANPPKKDETLNRSVSDTEDDYVPTAQFKPVIPLPDLVEVQTGEENEIVLFEHRAKLLRFDKQNSEWKERGIGNMKVLVDKKDPNTVRLIMRREIVHKLCCNQRLTKFMKFKKAPNTDTALSWCGQDYSENELNTELLTVRFKTAEICNSFHEAILKAQGDMTASFDAPADQIENKNQIQQGFGDKFKPKPGSWNCSVCYVQNVSIAKTCVACGTSQNPSDTIKNNEPKNPANTFNFAAVDNKTIEGFGDKFKPKAGSWNCEVCYVQNGAAAKACEACGTPNPADTNKSDDVKNTGSTFSFGIKPPAIVENKTVEGFGDKFKPKPGSWSCKSCYLSNAADTLYCVACSNPKDDTVPKKDTTQNDLFSGINPPKTSFTFGFANAAPEKDANAKKNEVSKNLFGTPTTSTFTFGFQTATSTPSTAVTAKSPFTSSTPLSATTPFSLTTTTASNPSGFTFGKPATTDVGKEQPSIFTSATTTTSSSDLPAFAFSSTAPSIFGVSKTSDSEKTTAVGFPSSFLPPGNAAKPNSEVDNMFKLEKKEFEFKMKPKSPGKAKSPLKSGGEEESDGENLEEENNAYFAPVIPLPEKVDVKTGEEDEEELYCHRTKLYRFAETEGAMEWKERGLGNVKILRHKQTHKLRVVMRREQVLKICLNHVLNSEVEYKRKDERSWHFIVNDFSEGELEVMHFCLRFKNKEIAEGFMTAVEKAIAGELEPISEEDTKNEQSMSKTVGISEEERNLADSLQLPHSFYEKSEHDCTGCRGCDPDKFEFSDRSNINMEIRDDNPIPLEMKSTSGITSSKPKESILKQSSLSYVTPTKENNDSIISTDSNLTKAPDIDTFTFSMKNSPATNGGFLFGNVGNSFTTQATTKPVSIFGGGSNLFGSVSKPNVETSEKSASPFIGFGGIKPPPSSTQQTTIFGGLGTGSSFTQTSLQSAVPEKSSHIPDLSSSDITKEPPKTFSFNQLSVFGSSLKPFADITPTFGSSEGNLFGSIPKPEANIEPGKVNETTGSLFKTAFSFGKTTTDVRDDSAQSPASGGLFKSALTFEKPAQAANNLIESEKQHTNLFSKPDESSTPAYLANVKEDISFASLAKQTANKEEDSFSKQADGKSQEKKEFVGLTNTDAFSSFLNPQGKGNDSHNTSNKGQGDGNDDSTHDPHYDPIIPLPKEIEVRTGEEDEEKLFGERGTLYRFDSTEKCWKERGVGEIKILYHPEKGTYRFLLRREQIHKLVLNHAITGDLNFAPMGKSGKAFLWAAQNFAEEPPQLEKLAVSFKNVQIATNFENKVKDCIEQLGKRANLQPEAD